MARSARTFLFFLLLLTCSSLIDAASASVVINEILTANISSSGLADENGIQQPWIELYNSGPGPVNLTGWSITDSTGSPDKWIFPNVTINAGAYLVVFASGEDRAPTSGLPLHLSFKLSPTGEYLALYDNQNPRQIVSEIAPGYPEQRNNISYGLSPSGVWKYYSTPTPRAINGDSAISSALEAVHFSTDHGFFSQSFNLVLSAAAGATIRYTVDGSEPTALSGLVYSAPLLINKTTIVRSAAFQAGLLPSLTETRSYLFIENVLVQPFTPTGYPTSWNGQGGLTATADYAMDQRIVTDPLYSSMIRTGMYSLPALSISLPKDDLFGTNGIYSNAITRDDTSDLWDRASSVELVMPDGSPGFITKSGLQILGGASRDLTKTPKHSFRIGFKDKFGPGKLAYPFFADSPLQEYNTLVLDATYNYGWTHSDATQRLKSQYVRDQWTADMQNAMGGVAAHGRYVHLYLNGLYWGIYDAHERPDDDFAANYGGGDKSEYDVVKVTSASLQVVAGNTTAFNAMMALATSGLTNNVQYQQMQQYLDLENFIDYMIINIYGGNTDWPAHNWYALRRRVAGAKFKWPVWDAEYVLKGNEDISNNLSGGNPATLYNNLRLNADFRMLFADRLQKHFFNGGVFYVDPVNKNWDPTHPERNMPASIYMRRIHEIDTAVVAESARWGDYRNPSTPYTRNTSWLPELNALLYITNGPSGNTTSYFPNRSATVLTQFKAISLYPSVVAPSFNQFGGRVPLGFKLSITAPSGTIYYTTNGIDPRVAVTAAVDGTAVAYTANVVLNSSMIVKSRVLTGGVWSALLESTFNVNTLGTPIRFTELNYNPIGGDTYEFFEIQNLGGTAINLGNYYFDGVTFSFPLGTQLAAGARMVLVSDTNPSAFSARYPAVTVSGYYGGKLSNTGERVALLDPAGNTVTSVSFKNTGGWPTQADGKGYSLEIINPLGDPNDPSNWKASAVQNGTPGIVNSTPPISPVVINEIMADNLSSVSNGTDFPDWIELRNTSGSPVNLNGWSLSNNGTPRRYILPSTNLAAGAYMVLWCDALTNSPGLHTGFALSRLGENVFLYDSSTNRMDAISFGPQVTDLSIGRVGAAWTLSQPTPNADNVAAATGSATNLVINEWMANSLSGQSDWLELYNKSTLPVPIQGIYLGTSNVTQQVESLSFVPALGFIQLFADETAGYDHLDFKLSSSGETVILSDQTGAELNRVTFGVQQENITQGRSPNGSANLAIFYNGGTPAAPNLVAAYNGPVLNELFAKNKSYYDSRGETPNWIELYNPSGADFSLSGMSLTDTTVSPGQWVFPSGSFVPANGYLLVYFDASRPATTNNTTSLNTGVGLPGKGGTVYLCNTLGQVVDSVTFGFQLDNLSIGRSGGIWTLLSNPTPGLGNAAPAVLGDPAALRINEWMANPIAGEDDWIELYNTASQPVSLSGLYLTDDPSISGQTKYTVGPLSYITAKGWIQWIADAAPGNGTEHLNFSLSSAGEFIRLYSSNFVAIDTVTFGQQSEGVSQGRLPDGAGSVVSFPTTSTPEKSNYLPLPNALLLNELLTHTDPPLEDAIELYNPGGTPVALMGWYLSDSENNLQKYQFGATTIPAFGYTVIYENQFNGGAGSTVPFTFNSAHGGTFYLSQADGSGNLTGYRLQVDFGPAANGVSFGRYPSSIGDQLVAMKSRTFGMDSPSTLAQFRSGTGLPNAYPMVGPIVINEIMYQPAIVTGTNDNIGDEYIELHNITQTNTPLYNIAGDTWKLSNAIDFQFPTNAVLPPQGFLLVVNFNPTNTTLLSSFKSRFNVPASTLILGPYAGKLSNSGEDIQLHRPDGRQQSPNPDAGYLPYILVDHVNYGVTNSWPSNGAQGGGFSLQRKMRSAFGNDPINWVTAAPTAGLDNVIDSDGDGIPDNFEWENGLNPNSAADRNLDNDSDGVSNFQEYLAGTNPNDSQDYLKLQINLFTGQVKLQFEAKALHSYSIQQRTTFDPGTPWIKWQDVTSVETNRTLSLPVLPPATNTFYKLVTPMAP